MTVPVAARRCLLRAAQDDWALGVALNNFAASLVPTDAQRAREPFEESLLLRRGIGEPRAIAVTAGNLAEAVLDAGELDYADTLINEAQTRANEIDFRPNIASALGTRAIISLLRDDHDGAGAHLREAIETATQAHEVAGFPAAVRLRARWQPTARAAVPDLSCWNRAWTAGAELSLDNALALAGRVSAGADPRNP